MNPAPIDMTGTRPPVLDSAVLEAIQEGISRSAAELAAPDVCVLATSKSGTFAFRYVDGDLAVYLGSDVIGTNGDIDPVRVRESKAIGRWDVGRLHHNDAVGIGLALRFWLGETARACGMSEPIWE